MATDLQQSLGFSGGQAIVAKRRKGHKGASNRGDGGAGAVGAPGARAAAGAVRPGMPAGIRVQGAAEEDLVSSSSTAIRVLRRVLGFLDPLGYSELKPTRTPINAYNTPTLGALQPPSSKMAWACCWVSKSDHRRFPLRHATSRSSKARYRKGVPAE